MLIYYLILTAVLALARLAERVKGRQLKRAFVCAAALILILFAGLRDLSVGADTSGYVRRHYQIKDLPDVLSAGYEVGYSVVAMGANSLGDGYLALLLIIAIICVSLQIYAIRRISFSFTTTLFVFVAMGGYTFFFNTARQGMAAAVLLAALPFLFDKRLLMYSLATIVASSFHVSALIALPIYFCVNFGRGYKKYLAMAACALVAGLLFMPLIELAGAYDEKYLSYMEVDEASGRLYVSFIVAIGLVFLWAKSRVRIQRATFDKLLDLYVAGILIALVAFASGTNPSGVLRLAFYFTTTAAFIWPILFANKVFKPLTAPAFLIFVIGYLAYFGGLVSTNSELVPYHLNAAFFYGAFQ